MEFADALRELRRGARIRRKGWEPSAFLCFVRGVMIVPDSTSAVRKYLPPAVDLKCGAHAILRAAQSVWEPGWTPTQSDMFADDWEVVQEPS